MRFYFFITVFLVIGSGFAQNEEPISIDRAGSDFDSSSSTPTGVIGIVTLWPKGSLQSRHDPCPKFGDWKNVTCWWPTVAYSDLPQECTSIPLPKTVPAAIQELIRSKAREVYDAIIYEYNQRGKPAKCGYCSRSFRCRSRNITDDDSDLTSDGRRRHPQCRLVQISTVM